MMGQKFTNLSLFVSLHLVLEIEAGASCMLSTNTLNQIKPRSND
jgi:hypothetical protein